MAGHGAGTAENHRFPSMGPFLPAPCANGLKSWISRATSPPTSRQFIEVNSRLPMGPTFGRRRKHSLAALSYETHPNLFWPVAMTFRQSKTGASTRARRARSYSYVLVAIFFSIVAIGLVVGRTIGAPASQQSASNSGSDYLGTIQLARNHDGRCEQYEFSNNYRGMRALGAQPCDMSQFVPDHSDGSIGRVNGIARFFKTR